MKLFFILACFVMISSACNKDDNHFDTSLKGDLSVEFDNIVGASDLQLDSGSYTNSSGESFTVTKLAYYVSNFSFTKSDGTIYTVPQDSAYFLIDEADESTHEPVFSVPEGEYTSVHFILGVDSLRSTKDAGQRTGVPDPASAAESMYWNANNGYIFFKMQGFLLAPGAGDKYNYEIGGYGGNASPTFNNIKSISLDLNQRGVPKVKAGKETNLHLMVDILKFFHGSTELSISQHPDVMFTDFSIQIANNFPAMINHDHTEN